jgi:hypothetical protein
MKTKTKMMLAALAAAGLLAGCATPYPVGGFYTGVTLPINATSNAGTPSKVGVAECNSILALFSFGDCSFEAAKKNGGITKVNHADWKAENILGIYGTYKLTVRGD